MVARGVEDAIQTSFTLKRCYLVQFKRSQGRTSSGLVELCALFSSPCGFREKSMQKLSHYPDPILHQGEWDEQGGGGQHRKREGWVLTLRRESVFLLFLNCRAHGV